MEEKRNLRAVARQSPRLENEVTHSGVFADQPLDFP